LDRRNREECTEKKDEANRKMKGSAKPLRKGKEKNIHEYASLERRPPRGGRKRFAGLGEETEQNENEEKGPRSENTRTAYRRFTQRDLLNTIRKKNRKKLPRRTTCHNRHRRKNVVKKVESEKGGKWKALIGPGEFLS